MPDEGLSSHRLVWAAALALTLPAILAAGPVAGYCIGWFLKRNFGVSDGWIPFLACLGMAGSALQTFKLIRTLNQTRSNGKRSQ